jgi:predicted nucleotidyltransferase
MNVFKSIDDSNTFMISGISYDMISVINSSLKNKISEINSRIVRTEMLKKETSDRDIFIQLKNEIEYLNDVVSSIKELQQNIYCTLDNI